MSRRVDGYRVMGCLPCDEALDDPASHRRRRHQILDLVAAG